MGTIRSDIFGLRSLEQPLEYLGLFNCDSASHFAEIPAKNVRHFGVYNALLRFILSF